MDTEKFTSGFRVSRHERAPDFIIANVGINIADFIAWANKHSDRGWVNIQIKKSKKGSFYAQLDEYKKPESPQNGGAGELEKEIGGHVEDTMTSRGVDGEEPISLDDIPF